MGEGALQRAGKRAIHPHQAALWRPSPAAQVGAMAASRHKCGAGPAAAGRGWAGQGWAGWAGLGGAGQGSAWPARDASRASAACCSGHALGSVGLAIEEALLALFSGQKPDCCLSW
jgi:hypothetical protein